jgi:hypothetical protein
MEWIEALTCDDTKSVTMTILLCFVLTIVKLHLNLCPVVSLQVSVCLGGGEMDITRTHGYLWPVGSLHFRVCVNPWLCCPKAAVVIRHAITGNSRIALFI